MQNSLYASVIAAVQSRSDPPRPVYLVGGAVRDLLLGRDGHDLDFAVQGPTRALAKSVANHLGGAFYVMDEERDTTRVVLTDTQGQRLLLDFASLRADTLEADLRARDFTLNAMAFDVTQPDHLIDPTGGLADLRAKIVRACSETSLQDDPLRVLRAVRISVKLQYRIDPDTLRQMRAAVPGLARVSAERQRDELFRMFDGAHVANTIRILERIGVLAQIMPELLAMRGITQTAPHVYDVWEHTLDVISQLERLLHVLVGDYEEESSGADVMTGLAVMRLGRFRDHLKQHFYANPTTERSPRALLFLAALYHDVAKPTTRTQGEDGKVHFLDHPEDGAEIMRLRAQSLALSSAETNYLDKLVRQHMRIHFFTNDLSAHNRLPSRRSIYRYFRQTGDTGIDLGLLALADVRGVYGITLTQEIWLAELDICRALFEAFWEQKETVVSPPHLLTGKDLITLFDMQPGYQIGQLLDAIREAQAVGDITSREQAIDYAKQWLLQDHAVPGKEKK